MNNNLNNETINNENVVFVPDILENLKPRDKQAFQIIVSSGVSEEKDAKELIIDRFIEEKDIGHIRRLTKEQK